MVDTLTEYQNHYSWAAWQNSISFWIYMSFCVILLDTNKFMHVLTWSFCSNVTYHDFNQIWSKCISFNRSHGLCLKCTCNSIHTTPLCSLFGDKRVDVNFSGKYNIALNIKSWTRYSSEKHDFDNKIFTFASTMRLLFIRSQTTFHLCERHCTCQEIWDHEANFLCQAWLNKIMVYIFYFPHLKMVWLHWSDDALYHLILDFSLELMR